MIHARDRMDGWSRTVKRLQSDPRLKARIEATHPPIDLDYPTPPAVAYLVEEVLAEELCEQGLDDKFEPNAYGVEIEMLIDEVNQFRLDE